MPNDLQHLYRGRRETIFGEEKYSGAVVKSWRAYERFVAELTSNQSDNDVTVIPNARLVGSITGVKRQIDVLLDYRYGDKIQKRVIVDAKRHKRRIDVKQVEAFEGMMKDVRASRGITALTFGVGVVVSDSLLEMRTNIIVTVNRIGSG